ncbi:MAG TPA: site-specific integrase [Limnochordia bacterium]
MAGKLERTGTPGIFRRHRKACDRQGRCDCPYVVPRPTMQTFATFAEAREGKAAAERRAKLAKGHAAGLHRDAPRDECPECERERVERERAEPTLHEYAREWVERYQGTGRRGFREETRDEWRRLLERFALRYFGEDVRLSDITPRDIADYIGWLVKQPSRRGGTLSDSSVHNACKPLFACLATARREGLIDHNPASGATLPHRPRVQDDEERARPFPRVEIGGETVETMELVVSLVHPDYRLLFELLAATGVRRSELLAFEGRHLDLDGDRPYVKVRQRVRRRRGEGLVIGPLKSRHARRDLPIPLDLADRLRALRTAPDALVFPSKAGTILDPDNLYERVLSPACAEAGVEWAGFHTFRHTVASRLFAQGRNVVQVQRWLGHHSPSFTLDTYVHLLDGDLGDPLEPLRVNAGSTERPETAANGESGRILEIPD